MYHNFVAIGCLDAQPNVRPTLPGGALSEGASNTPSVTITPRRLAWLGGTTCDHPHWHYYRTWCHRAQLDNDERNSSRPGWQAASPLSYQSVRAAAAPPYDVLHMRTAQARVT